MPKQKRTKSQPKDPHPKCRWCKKHREARDKHRRYCRQIHDYCIPRQNAMASGRPLKSFNHRYSLSQSNLWILSHLFSGPCSGGRHEPDSPRLSPVPTDIDDSDNHSQHDPRIFVGPLLPGAYLRVVPHAHSTDPTPKIVPIDSPPQPNHASKDQRPLREDDYGRTPWFPFRTRADF
jgi:hypothetical protein